MVTAYRAERGKLGLIYNIRLCLCAPHIAPYFPINDGAFQSSIGFSSPAPTYDEVKRITQVPDFAKIQITRLVIILHYVNLPMYKNGRGITPARVL